MDLEIKSSLDLYKRLSPAMSCKERELKRNNIDYIKKEDVWNYLMKNKWKNAKGLTLDVMVDDILNVDNKELDRYVKDKIKLMEEKIEQEEIELL
ncbi:MAG: hypothetical protein J6A52_03070 [Bacilli bacterium]|nr:hypothetical protein [Bacilli bacterium]